MALLETVYNPDILNCLANLSNDEVFTPPEVVNRMLDMLPQELFRDKHITFLDPACKTGVFLREIAKRLLEGLKEEIPDEEERRKHIFTKQLYGIAITEMTSLLSRRGLYCSKFANGRYSIVPFDQPEGNIRFKNIGHYWTGDKCGFCGASKDQFQRNKDLEQYAYEFIHTSKPEEMFSVKFDVIIGNPPYQLNTAGDDNGPQARPIYQNFVMQAIKLSPRFLVMITPSRWFSGGWGLDEFRDVVASKNHIREIHDFQNSSDCFQGVDIKGGVSYFLYERDYCGKCNFVSHEDKDITSSTLRYLLEDGCETVIRYNTLISVSKKIRESGFSSFSSIVSGRSPFGLNTNHYGTKEKGKKDDLLYFERTGIRNIDKDRVTKNHEYINKYKLFTAKTAEDGRLPGKVIGNITLGEPGVICSGTYLVVGPFIGKQEAENALLYMKTKFFRALVSMNKISQNAYAKVYDYVPLQDFSKSWTDTELYTKYRLSDEEISFIESMIRPMDLEGVDNA